MRTIARASVPLISHQMARKGKFSGSEVKIKEEACYLLLIGYIILGFPGGSAGKQSVCNAGDLGLIPGLGRSPGEGNGNPLQYTCLENPMDRGTWRATVHGVTKETRLSTHTWLNIKYFLDCLSLNRFHITPCPLLSRLF